MNPIGCVPCGLGQTENPPPSWPLYAAGAALGMLAGAAIFGTSLSAKAKDAGPLVAGALAGTALVYWLQSRGSA